MSYKSPKSEQFSCKQENKTIIISWLEISISNVPPVIKNISCNNLFECQTKYGSIENIPDNCSMKKHF